MEIKLKFKNEKETYDDVYKSLLEYDTIILDLLDRKIDAFFLNYLLKLFRLTVKYEKDIVFLSENELGLEFRKYIRMFKNYEEYEKMKIFIGFSAKIYMNDLMLTNLIKTELTSNAFITKERSESSLFQHNHDCRIKDIYIIDFDNYKKRKIEEIRKIKSKNNDTSVVVFVRSEEVSSTIKALNTDVDAIIQKPIDIENFTNIIKKIAINSNLKYENRALNDKLKNMLNEINSELLLAKDIQESFLPKNNLKINGYNISYIFKPIQEIGGDYFDIVCIDKTKIAVIFADISGHGLSAALLSSMLRVFIRTQIFKFKKTNDFALNLNEKIIEIFPQGKFVSLFYLIIDTKNHKVRYCKASQEPALILNKGKIIELETEGQVLGVFSKKDFPEIVEFEEKEIEFDNNAKLLLYTDGIIESYKNGNMYGIDKLKEEFIKNESNIQAIEKSLKDYEIDDDLTLLTIYRDNNL